MASSLPSFCSLDYKRLHRHRIIEHLQVRSQIYSSDEGKSSNIVDANLRVLRERIEEVRTKQRLEKCMMVKNSWNFIVQSHHDNKIEHNEHYKRDLVHSLATEFYSLELKGLANGAIAFVFLGATLWICLVSFLVLLTKS